MLGLPLLTFYGVGIERYLAEAPAMRCPLLLHFAALDQYVPEEARNKVAAGLTAKPLATIHVYPGAEHGFYTRGDTETVRLAHQRTVDFLDRSLATTGAGRV